jgi:hypothetical protein
MLRATSAHAELDRETARKLFLQAVDDEQNQRMDGALAKFRRVQAEYKDTVNVRFRIGACLESLGQLSAALASYKGAMALAAGDATPETAETAKAAEARAGALDARVGRLHLALSPHAPSDAEVRVDDAVIAREAMTAAVIVDPGRHVIAGAARDVAPFRSEVALPEGGQISLVVVLEPAGTAPPPTSSATTLVPPPVSNGKRTAGFVALAAGGAILAGTGITFYLRHQDISTINDACLPSGCPLARKSELDAAHSRAELEWPLGVTLGIVGGCAALAGIFLVATSSGARTGDARASLRVTPSVSPTGGASLDVRGVF